MDEEEEKKEEEKPIQDNKLEETLSNINKTMEDIKQWLMKKPEESHQPEEAQEIPVVIPPTENNEPEESQNLPEKSLMTKIWEKIW